MSRQAITVELSEEVYEQVKRAAQGMNHPVEQVLANIVRAATPSLEKVPAEYRSELASLEILGDEQLWQIARSQLPSEQQLRSERLLRKLHSDGLTDREQQSLTRLRKKADQLTLRKSYAYLLLKYRGHRIRSLPATR